MSRKLAVVSTPECEIQQVKEVHELTRPDK